MEGFAYIAFLIFAALIAGLRASKGAPRPSITLVVALIAASTVYVLV